MTPNSSTDEPADIRAKYIVTTVILVAIGVVLGIVFAQTSQVEVVQVEGMAAFAILYALAQTIERVNQFLVPIADFVLSKIGVSKTTASDNKKMALQSLRTARMATVAYGAVGFAAGGDMKAVEEAAKDTAEQEQVVTTANKEKSLLTNGLAFVLAMVAVGLFKFSLLASIGYTSVPAVVDLIVTASAIMGGSSGLSDVISKVQKSKTASETGA